MTSWLILQALVVAIGLVAAAMHVGRVAWRARVLVLRACLVAIPVALAAPSLLPAPPEWTPARGTFAVVDAPAGPLVEAVAHAPVPAAPLPLPPWWIVPLVGLIALGADSARLAVRLGRAPLRHRLRGLDVRLGDASLAVRLNRRVVVLDRSASASDLRVALRHELQHHRHRDPEWAWAWAMLRALCWVNPLALALVRHARGLDELACDEAVRLDRLHYADALVRSARRSVPLPAAAFGSNTLLNRRIEMLLSPPSLRRLPLAPAAAFVATLLTATVWTIRPAPAGDVAPSAVVEDDPVVDSRAQRMAKSDWIRDGLKQTETIEYVKRELAAAGLPADLAAVPLVESGYRNLGPEANKHMNTAGIWQFIPATARAYGLRVHEGLDERRDLEKSTAAALHLLGDLHEQFGDWGLALAAYNVGSKKVRDQMKHFGEDDVLGLIEADALPSYAADVMAGAALLRTEGLIE